MKFSQTTIVDVLGLASLLYLCLCAVGKGGL